MHQLSIPPRITPAKLEKWNMALGTTMKTTDYICHLHFKEEDIKMYDTLNIKGEIIILPSGKKTLRDQALPTIEHQFISIGDLQKLQTSLNKSLNLHSYQNQSENKRDHITQEHQDQNKQQELLLDQGIPDNLVHVIQQTEHYLDIPQLNQESHDDIQNEKSDLTSQSVDKYLENIKTSPLPPGWMYFEKPEGLEFGRINPRTMQISNRIRVNNDLSITVIFSTNEELNINDNISSFNGINDYLKSVERWPICVGTQIDNNKCSKFCKGVLVGDESYKRNQQNPRCKSCRILRHRLQSYNSTSTVLKSAIARRRTYNQQKQCKRLKKMNTRLKQELLNLKNQFAEIEEVLSEEIVDLPALQQQTTTFGERTHRSKSGINDVQRPEGRDLHPAARGSAVVVVKVRTAEGEGGWHPPRRKRQTAGGGAASGEGERDNCLCLLVETAVAVCQSEKEQEEVPV
ncbi:unnamed protein product [Euphydryas editha]|uniref:THAP-type domain-containing protein n=1 Tax=Euphydryas editha TaxID=104508 RepID=A0AAU9TWR0_EUPED|nr:unnamed protein product [Euphydryas editha]